MNDNIRKGQEKILAFLFYKYYETFYSIDKQYVVLGAFGKN